MAKKWKKKQVKAFLKKNGQAQSILSDLFNNPEICRDIGDEIQARFRDALESDEYLQEQIVSWLIGSKAFRNYLCQTMALKKSEETEEEESDNDNDGENESESPREMQDVFHDDHYCSCCALDAAGA